MKNLGASLLKNVAMRTNEVAGDGTTTATVLARNIFNEGCKRIGAGVDPTALKRGVDRAVARVLDELKQSARTISSKQEIRQVATVSANGDDTIGAMIGRAMEKVGKEGVITVEEGRALTDTLEVVQGVRFDSGYASPYLVTDAKAMKTEFENPLVFLCDKRLSAVQDIVAIATQSKFVQQRRPLLIVAEDIDNEALATLVLNKLHAGMKICAVKAPGYGESRRAWLQDLAVLTGGEVFSPDAGMSLEKIPAGAFGTVRKAVVTKDSALLQGGAGDPRRIRDHCEALKGQVKGAASEWEKERLQSRVAKLSGGVAVIKVGGASEVEVGEKKDRVQDALNATKAAVEEGIVPGGGSALLHSTKALAGLKEQTTDFDERVGIQIIIDALRAPTRQICENAGAEGVVVVRRLLEERNKEVGYNAMTGKFGNMFAAGIIDPVKVVRAALTDASSVASTLLTADACIVDEPKRNEPASAPRMPPPPAF
eukprot:gnl/Trimastix_PCT/3606.p1 GENE.gnl/Trimastix_PCT/3606~~gnl/Trimastix_PCT/3606.p1  ORF type:complete len:483 (+),score=180.43 gnl/Trimastix_PCT/3606:198-1646(+)